MNTSQHTYAAPTIPTITDEMIAAIEELLSGIPDDEPLPVADQVAVVVQEARFSAEQESQPAALLRDLVAWLQNKHTGVLCDFLDALPDGGLIGATGERQARQLSGLFF